MHVQVERGSNSPWPAAPRRIPREDRRRGGIRQRRVVAVGKGCVSNRYGFTTGFYPSQGFGFGWGYGQLVGLQLRRLGLKPAMGTGPARAGALVCFFFHKFTVHAIQRGRVHCSSPSFLSQC
jgi:hypothetical protein